jgi:hypothetical protein
MAPHYHSGYEDQFWLSNSEKRFDDLASWLESIIEYMNGNCKEELSTIESCVAREWLRLACSQSTPVPANMVNVITLLRMHALNGTSPNAELRQLFDWVVRPAYPQRTTGGIRKGSSGFAREVLFKCRYLWPKDCVSIAEQTWRQSVQDALAYSENPGKMLYRISSDLCLAVHWIDLPETYSFLISLLHGPFAVYRNDAAHWLKCWQSDTLRADLNAALRMAREDGPPFADTTKIERRLRKLDREEQA